MAKHVEPRQKLSLVYQENVAFYSVHRIHSLWGYFFNVFVIGHHSLAQLNQVETSAVETLSCFKHLHALKVVYAECFLQEKENVQLLVLSLHSTEIQVSET